MRAADVEQIRSEMVAAIQSDIRAADPTVTDSAVDGAVKLLMRVWDAAMEMNFKSCMDLVAVLQEAATEPRLHAQASGLMLAAKMLRESVEGLV